MAAEPEILESFRKQGLRCTSQRYVILKYLMAHPTHPTVEEIHKAINRNHPRASRATVYNGLHALAQAGLVREVTVTGQATRFESHIESHHHFVCDRCGRIEDLEWFDLPEVARRARVAPRKMGSWELILHGLCESCSSKPKEKLQWEK